MNTEFKLNLFPQVLERIGEKRTLLNNLIRRKVISIGHIPRRNCLLRNAIEGQMTEGKGVDKEEEYSSFMI